MPGRPKRLTHAFLALLLGLVLCEIGLRAVGFVYLSVSGRGAAGDGAGPVILCHGDSNVFGIYEDAHESWPARLGSLLDGLAPDLDARVVNLGVPGLNSRQLAAALPTEIDRSQPAAVMITIGANNGWAWFDSEELTYEEGEIEEPAWWEELRVLKLLQLSVHRLTGVSNAAEPVFVSQRDAVRVRRDDATGERRMEVLNREGEIVHFRTPTDGEIPSAHEFEASIRRDIARIAAHCAERDLPLILVGYGADRGTYLGANNAMRQSARELDLPLAYPAPHMDELVDRIGFDQVFHLDLHPRGTGYEVIARTAYGVVVDQLGIEARPIPDLLAGIGPREYEATSIVFQGEIAAPIDSVEAPTLELTGGTPNYPFTAAIWGLRRPDAPYEAKPVGQLFADDALFRATLENPALNGTFDEDGNASVALAAIFGANPDALPKLAGNLLEAAYMTHPPGDRDMVTSISETCTLTLR